MTGGNHDLEKQDGVIISSTTFKNFSDFETNYLAARDKEKRILSIEEIRRLPEVDKNYLHYSEWQIRKKNINRFLYYLGKKKKGLRILDIGSGNGFFTNLMAKENSVVGVDVNLTELKQASLAFPSARIKWYYLDILNEVLPEEKFDLIVFCASFQYFDKPLELLKRCESLLNDKGEIHIIDSPFYTEQSRQIAKKNSRDYYTKMNVASMINYYHHNTYDVLKNYDYSFMYKPGSLLSKILRSKDSPFPWMMIKRKS